MALIKLQDRFKIYRTLLTRMKHGDGVTGLCYHLVDLADKVCVKKDLNYQSVLKKFPEIDKHRPSVVDDDYYPFWFKKDKEGYAMRRWICREAIRETSKKLLKYQKLKSS